MRALGPFNGCRDNKQFVMLCYLAPYYPNPGANAMDQRGPGPKPADFPGTGSERINTRTRKRTNVEKRKNKDVGDDVPKCNSNKSSDSDVLFSSLFYFFSGTCTVISLTRASI